MIEAQLSNDGTEIRCGRPIPGRPICGRRLAQVICGEGGGFHPLMAKGTKRPRRTDSLTRFGGSTTHDQCNAVSFPGWLQNTETRIWKLTRYAKGELQRDHWLASDNPGVDPKHAERARLRLQEGRSTRFRRPAADDQPGEGGEAQQARDRIDLPAEMECPTCGAINHLPWTRTTLRAEAMARQDACPATD